ncbi:MAG: hypothetical protein K9J75_08635 [Cyanobium usitatum Tobar12.5m-G36]|nr:hypothetical protein [Cyanobium usitatum Tobar12.5m-G36]
MATADAITIGAGTASGTATDVNTLGEEKITIATGTTLNVSAYTNEELAGFIKQGTGALNVTTATGAVLTSANLADATTITIGAGTATIDASSTDEVALAAKSTVNNGTTLTINNYVNTDLSGLSNQGTGSIVVNTTTSAVLDESKLADATSVVLGAAATGAASAIDGIGTNGSRINLNSQILSVSDYTNQDLSGIITAGTLNVTTINGAVIDATKLATADSVTLVGTNTATSSDADTLGSRLGGTATLNITTDPITATTDLSDLGSGLSLQFGGDTTAVVTGVTLTVRQDQVSGYTISGTGTVAAAGTSGADTFNASGITANTNFTSLAGADSVTIAPSALGSVDVIDSGADTDTLIFSAAASVVDVAFTNVSSVEILQLAAGTNSITLGVEAEQAGITTVTGNTGADTLNLLYGTAGLTFNAGTGSDTLSYSADSTAQAIALSSISLNAASGSVVNNGTDSFTGLEAIVGGSGTGDSIASTSVAEALIVTGANAGTIDGFTFSGVESVNLGDGNDTGTINMAGSLGGSLNFGAGTADSLTYAGYGSAVSSTLSGSNTLSSVTAITGGVSGVENITLSSNNDTLTIAGSGSLSGNVDFGTGSDTLTYAGNANAVTVSLNSATSTAAAGATGITGTTTGFETLIGGSGSTDMLNATSGVNTLSVASGGTTTLDSSLTVSGFETINLGASADASSDTATVSGAFSGTIDLGAGNDTATINNGGSVTSLAGGSGTDTLNLDSANQAITVTGTGAGTSAGSSGGTTTFSGFETVNGLAGDDAFTINSASASTITIDGGTDTDSLSVASSDTAANSLTLSAAGGGTLGGVSFANVDNVSLGSGSDSITLASGGGLVSSAPGLLADFYNESGNGAVIGSLLRSGVVLETVNVQDETLQSLLGKSDNIYLYAQGFLTVPGTGTYNDFILSTTSDDGVRVKIDLAGTGSFSSVIDNWTTHGDVNDFSTNQSVTAGQRIPIQIEWFDSGGGATLELYYQSSSQGISRTLVPLSNLSSGTQFSSTSGILDLGSGSDSVAFQPGTFGVSSLIGGAGTDTLNYSSYGSAVTVNLATSTATGTGGISGFETVLGSAASDTITASSSGVDNLQGSAGADTFNITVAGLTSTDTIDGGTDSDTLVFTDAGVITDAQFTNVTTLETVNLTGASTISAGTEASQAGIATINTGTGTTTVNSTAANYDLTVNAANLADNASLTLTGSANTNDFTVTNLTGSVLASGTSGTLAVTTGDAADNAIGVTTGSGATTITANSSGDTVTTNAAALAQNTLLSFFGAARQVVTNLVGNLTGANLTGTLNVTTANAADNGISITTGSGNVVIDGGDATDTITVTSLSTNNQTFNAQASTSNFKITADANNQTITGSNTGSDTIDGGTGTDTLSYAGGINVDVTVNSYSTQAGASTGQGTDSFSNIETLEGAMGNDILRGTTSATDEVVTVTGANTGTIRDSASTGSFSFNSFEQLDLQGGNDTLTVNGNTSGVSLSGSVELGSGNNILTMEGSAGSIAALSSGTGNDTFTISAGSITGALLSGDGNDTVLINSTSSTVGGNLDLGAGTGDTLSYAGYGNAVSVTLSDITSNTGSTAAAGATAITGTATGFENLVGGSTTGDTLTDSTGNSSVAITGANSGTIDGLAFSSIENLSLSTGDDTVTVTGNGSGVSLTGSLDLGDGTNSLTMNSSAGSIASVTSGTGDDTFSISSGSVTGAVSSGNGSNKLTISGTSSSIGSYLGGTGTDSITLSGGDVVGNVSTSTGNDTVLISSTASTIGGNLNLETGDSDTLSYDGYSNAVSVTLTGITSNAGSTAGGGATAIGGIASGFESLIGGSNSGDTVTDSTGDSTIVINGANSGTIDGMAFSAIENLSLSTGIDGVIVQTGGSLSGNLNLGDGTSNTLTMDSGAGAIGSVTANGGNDTFTITGGTVTGAVNLGNGINELKINDTASTIGSYTGGSGIDTIDTKGGDILGAVNTGSAGDSLTLTLGATITGAVTLGANSDSSDGNDFLSLNASSIKGAVTTGSGADEVTLSATSSVNGNITLGIDGDTYTASNADTLTLNASTVTGNVTSGSGADKVGVLTTSKITGNITLGSNTDSADGADTLTVTGTSSSSKSEITGSITTGAGEDTLDLTNATIGGASQTISLGTDSNSLDGNDRLSATGTAITATITTGSGSDSLALSSGSSITGNVTLGLDGDNQAIADYPNTITDYFASSSGWTGGTLDSTNAYYGSFLGPYAAGTKTNYQDVYKSFSFNGQPAKISFDFIKLDSWDGESFSAFINNTAAFSGNFSAGQQINSNSGSTNGFSWTIAPKDSLAHRGFAGWEDQTATVTIALPAGYSNLKFGFGSTLDQGIGDESYGIDNFSITPSILRHNDTLSLDASSITGNVITGSGADAVSVLTGSKITGSVNLGANTDTSDSGDTLTVTGVPSGTKSVITGSITTGGGADELKFTDATIGAASQTLSLGSDNNNNDGNDSLISTRTGITATLTTGSGSDTVTLSDSSSLTGDITLGSNTDSADGGDTLTVTGTSSSSKSEITGSIATGAGADEVKFTDATIGGANQTISLGSDSNSLDGNDILSASGTTITSAITTGSGSDKIALSANSSVIGNVSLGINAENETAIDAFDSLSGWTGGVLNNSSSYFGSFLGRYGNGTKTNGQDVSKSFALSSQPATISFDFIKFDTWDGEAFTAYVNDTAAFTSSFRYGQSISSASGSTNGFNWTIAPKDSLSTHGFGGWENQTASITITLPSGYSNFNKLGFGSNLDEGISNESYGIDNLTISPIILNNDDGLTLDASSIIGNVTTGTAADTVTLSNSSTITGSVNLGSNTDANDGNDSLTLSSGSKIIGNVDFGTANDTLTLSTGISNATTVTGDVAFGVGNSDTLSYSGNAGPITVALDGITADAVGTTTAAKASYITGNVTGFEAIVGSDYITPASDSVSGDAIYDNTGASLVVLTGANTGTIDNLDFSSIENLQLRSGADTLSFQGSSGALGLIAGLADGGGIEGATYSNGVYSGGTKTDTAIDLLDYTTYNAGGVSVDLSQNQATGVYGGLAGGLISGDGSIATETTDSSFENVDGSRFNDTITGDDQTNQANVLRGFDGADTIKGLAGNDTIDGGNGVGSNITDGADTIEGGDGADTIIASFGNDTISGGISGTASDELIDTLTYSATAISSARIEGLDISLTGTDEGTVAGDANSTLSVSTFTNTYNSSINQQLITAPTNQVSNDWTQAYTDIQNLVLSEQSDILRIDSTDVNTGSIDAKGGSLDTLDYSSFGAASPVLVNLSGAAYSFDFDANKTIDTKLGEITITNANSATNVMVTAASSQGGSNGVTGFEAVIGGAADDAIVGNDSDNLLVGNAGDDRIAGGAGNDTIYGGTGDDYIVTGEGSDYVVAGAGINTIAITSSDLAQDTFNVDPNGINIFALQGNGTSGNSSSIDAPTGNWDPGSQGIDLLDGGDPVVTGGVTVYDTINGTNSADTYQFGGVALKNIGNVSLGAGNDSLGTAATTKGVKVNYDGGSGTDSVTLNLTFSQFAKLNASGLYVADVQNYLDNASGKTFSSSQADFTASSFETGGVAVITPGVFNALQGDPAATTFNSAYGLRSSTISSGDDINLSASALTTSTATALSVPDIVSAFVQASGVKGSDAISVTSGGSTTGTTTASQDASAVSRTVDDRADSVLSAYGLGTDRSSFTAGDAITLSLSGNVEADTTAESLGFVVNASGTVEVAGSRDSSLTAGDALSLSISGTAAQTVGASNVAGLALASLASRTYGIDDANLTDTSTDSVQAGTDLSLQATANSSNRVTAQTLGTESLGTITLFDNTAAANDRFTITQTGAAFPLINGDRVRFTTSNASVQADRDYYVFNVIPVTGEFQLSSEPNGDPIDIVVGDSLQAYRPAVATADAISTVTGVDLNRTAANGSGVQAGDSLSLRASAADAIAASATSVAGDATAGVFRLGGMDGFDLASEVSSVQALADTASLAGNSASFSLTASDTATLKASSTDGAALTEANIQVFGSKSSASTAGDDLSLSTQAALILSGSAGSTSGSAEARSGAGAGAGVTTPGTTANDTGFVQPTSSSYSVVTGLADGTQTAGADLAVQAKAATTLNATASTVSGAETLGSLWTSATGNILSTFNTSSSTPSFIGPQLLAEGQLVQLPTAAAGLLANTDYAVKLLGFGAVNATADTLTMPTGVTYANGDAVRFRLNSTTAPDSSESRYGLALGTTYYVVNASGSTFQLSAAPSGSVIDLSADTRGAADQLVDADRFQLLVPPTAPGGTYSVAPLTTAASVSLTLPAVANAFAGSREADRTLNNSDSLNLAQLSGISGNAGLRGLIAGAQNAITAMATGVLNAVARNTANDATASAGLVAEGLSDTAITAGSAGTVKADATISAVADAATTGNNALIDNALADLTVTARGLTASNTSNDISIGGVGDVQATAALAGRSTSSTVVGDSDALAALKATGLEALSAGFTATIGQQGDFSAAAVIGTAAAPLLVEAISAASGDATVQAASTAIGILGSYTAPGFSSLQAGAAQGDISGSASADLNLRAIAVDGAASVSLGTADIFGIKDMALTTGADFSQISATALGQATLLAQTVELDATSAGSTSVRGLFSSAAAALPVSFSEDGRIGAIAQQSSFSQSISVNGNASSTLSNDSLGIGNAAITIDGVGTLDARAISLLDNRAQSVTGAASA